MGHHADRSEEAMGFASLYPSYVQINTPRALGRAFAFVDPAKT